MPVLRTDINADTDVQRFAAAVVAPPWTPLDLGASLKAWWNADDTVNGIVSTWTDRIGSLPAIATAGIEPVSAATSFNSAYRALTFDGVDDCLTRVTPLGNLPLGATPGEVWALASCTALGSVGVGMIIILYGSTGAQARGVQRFKVGNTNRASLSDGATTFSDTVIDVSGPHIYGGFWSGTTEAGRIDGRDFTPPSGTIATLNTVSSRMRIGAGNGAAANQFWTGSIRHVLVTLELTLLQRQQLEGWMAWSHNLVSLLPAGHPYKSVAP